jgi:hypothetical protein
VSPFHRALLWLSLTGIVQAFGSSTATPEPAAIEAKSAELAQIRSQMNANTQAEVAAEAYSTARATGSAW